MYSRQPAWATRSGRAAPDRYVFPDMPAILFATHPAFAGFHAQFSADGYQLRPRTRPWMRADGTILVRLVWRRRRDHASAVIQQTLRLHDGEAPAL